MKIKTVKSAKKRVVKITSTGKMLRGTLSAQHLAVGKSKRTRRASDKEVAFAKADQKKIKKLIPNG